MKRLTSQEIFEYSLLCIVLTFGAWVSIKIYIDNASLKRNKEFAKAVVIGFSTGSRESKYVDFEFIANDTLYEGSRRYRPRTDIMSIGDTIIIEYDRTDPTNNRLYRGKPDELENQP